MYEVKTVYHELEKYWSASGNEGMVDMREWQFIEVIWLVRLNFRHSYSTCWT